MDFLRAFFTGDGFMPHGGCYQWSEPLIALHAVSDAFTFLAYMSLPLTMYWMLRKKGDIPFDWMFGLFMVWIAVCGVVHLLEIITIWYPVYWMSGIFKLILGLGSVPTAYLLLRLIPRAIALPSPHALRKANSELIAANQELERLGKALADARDQALESTRQKAQFLANTSHELRTPVAGVLGITEILGATKMAPEQVEIVSGIDQAGHSLLTVINNILDLSKMDARKIEIESEPFCVKETVDDVSRGLTKRARKKGLKVLVRVDPAIDALLLGDAMRVKQVLSNFCDNALKFTDSGEIAISVEMEHRETESCRVKFEVRDTGHGIEPELRRRLFNPELSAEEWRSITGDAGLGLAICQKLVALMDGRIGVDEINGTGPRGHGSNFWFILPFKTITAVAQASQNPGSSMTGLKSPFTANTLVLVVDDSRLMREVNVMQLHRLGVTAHAVRTGEEALEAVQNFDYSLVLMDCHIPDMDGYRIASIIREQEQTTGKHLPIYGMTASSMPEDLERCLTVGMEDCLSKPVSLDQLKLLLLKVAG